MIALFLRLNAVPIGKAAQISLRKVVGESQIQIGRIKLFVDLLV